MNWSALGTIVAIVGITAGGVTYISKLDARANELEFKIDSITTKTQEIKQKTSDLDETTNSIKNSLSTITTQNSGVSIGTVAFFDLNSCPEGWEVFKQGQGRVVVAATENSITGLTFRKLGDQGGAEIVTLTKEQIPPHSHTITLHGRSGNNAFVVRDPSWGYDDWAGSETSASTSGFGGGGAHENMPPFHVLLQCKKK